MYHAPHASKRRKQWHHSRSHAIYRDLLTPTMFSMFSSRELACSINGTADMLLLCSSVCLSVCLYVCMSVCMCVCLPVYLPACVYLPVYLFASLYVCKCIYRKLTCASRWAGLAASSRTFITRELSVILRRGIHYDY